MSSQRPSAGSESSDHAFSENSDHLPVALPGQKIVGDSASDEGKDDRMLKRHEIQVLRRAGHTWAHVAALTGVSVETARRVAVEEAVATVDNAAEPERRQIGRSSAGALPGHRGK
jgi:hypothetical protein